MAGRAFGSMVQGGMDVEKAVCLSGLLADEESKMKVLCAVLFVAVFLLAGVLSVSAQDEEKENWKTRIARTPITEATQAARGDDVYRPNLTQVWATAMARVEKRQEPRHNPLSWRIFKWIIIAAGGGFLALLGGGAMMQNPSSRPRSRSRPRKIDNLNMKQSSQNPKRPNSYYDDFT